MTNEILTHPANAMKMSIHSAFIKQCFFLQLFHKYGSYYFDSIRNWDKDKNKLLQIYGYNLEDDLTGKFEFIYKEGKPFLKVLDTTIKRVAPTIASSTPAYLQDQSFSKAANSTDEEVEIAPTKRLGLVFNFNAIAYPYFTLDAIQGDADSTSKKYFGKTEKIDLTKYVNTEVFSEDDKMLLQQIRKLQATEVK